MIVHEEARSQARNPFEETLIGPLLRALADPEGHASTARHGLGVVVPHRAQRIALRNAYPELRLLDPGSPATYWSKPSIPSSAIRATSAT